MTAPFLICTIGRSRSAWLSRLLTYRDWTCDHEQSLTMRSVADVAAFFARSRHGSAESAAAPGWDVLRHMIPDLRTVIVRRPVDDVVAAFMALDLGGNYAYHAPTLTRAIAHVARALDRVARQPGVLVLDFADLVREDACAAIWRHCLPYAWDRSWWQAIAAQNVQCGLPEQIAYYHANREAVEAFKQTIAREMRRLARAGEIGRSSPCHP